MPRNELFAISLLQFSRLPPEPIACIELVQEGSIVSPY
jgi:hypothetical protein